MGAREDYRGKPWVTVEIPARKIVGIVDECREFLCVHVFPVGARDHSGRKPRKTMGIVCDFRGFLLIPTFPVGVGGHFLGK